MLKSEKAKLKYVYKTLVLLEIALNFWIQNIYLEKNLRLKIKWKLEKLNKVMAEKPKLILEIFNNMENYISNNMVFTLTEILNNVTKIQPSLTISRNTIDREITKLKIAIKQTRWEVDIIKSVKTVNFRNIFIKCYKLFIKYW